MCILFIYTDPAPSPNRYRLIIASNRDEYYTRPARKAFKCERTGVIAGRDMEIGREYGSWLGVSTKRTADSIYRFGALLNVTGESKQSHKGRGFIVINYLENDTTIDNYRRELHVDDASFHSYNFVTVELGSTIKVSHTTNAENQTDTSYEGTGFFAFGNSTVQSPLQKVTAGKAQFESIVHKFNNTALSGQLTYQLIELLKWKEKHLPDPELESRAPETFEARSAVYVELITQGYGTRTHTVILVDYDWNLHFKEVTMKEPIIPQSPEWENTHFTHAYK